MTVLLALFGTPSFSAPIAGPITNSATGHIYYLLSPDTWTTSEQEAVTLGGHLATINNQAEQDWVFDTFSSVGGVDRSLWIGLNDAQTEGVFTWVSGEPVGYLNWLDLQPDNSPVFGGEDYVHLMRKNNGFGHPAGKWNDMDNFDSFPELEASAGVVEVVPEPHTLVAISSVLTALAAGKRRAKG